MTRNLKALGLTLVAVFAMSALAAAAAQAEVETAEFSWDETTSRLTAEEDPATPIQITTIKTKAGSTVKFECDEPHFEVAINDNLKTKGAKTIKAANLDYSDTATTPANPSTCTGTAGAKVPMKFNGCETLLHAGTTIKSPPDDGESEGTLSIECPVGKEIVIEGPGCTVRIKNQTVGPVYFRTETTVPESVTIEKLIGTVPGATHNKATTYSTEGIICGVQNGRADGTSTGNTTVTAFDTNNNRTNVTVT